MLELAGLEQDFKVVFSSIPTDAKTAADVIANLNEKIGMTGPFVQDASKKIIEMSGSWVGTQPASVSIRPGDGRLEHEADQAGGTLDKMFVATQQSGIGIDALMQKVVQFGAPLRNMGFTLDDSVALLASFEKEGVNTELVLGALRIASGKFAEAAGDTTEKIKGGVSSMAEARDKLTDLKNALHLAQMKQGEFTEKTKESTRVQNETQIAKYTREI